MPEAGIVQFILKMKTLKNVLRLLALAVIIICASFGMGLMGNILGTNRERYMDKQIKIEQVDKKEDDDEGDSDEAKA